MHTITENIRQQFSQKYGDSHYNNIMEQLRQVEFPQLLHHRHPLSSSLSTECVIEEGRRTVEHQQQQQQCRRTVHLDHAASTIPPRMLIDAIAEDWKNNLYSNPRELMIYFLYVDKQTIYKFFYISYISS